jgi:nondiscriminating glutamyl-tRNA synthetase
MTEPERARFRAEGRLESIRFAVPDRDWILHDLIRGEVRFPAGMVGDFVLVRSNGHPTYNFAAAVDDAAMRITDVIRAEEHLANTPRQMMLYEALGEQPPAFAHVPLILNRDRTKMSKRSGEAAVAVSDWRRAGYVAEAQLSYLALLGFHTGDEREILSRAELLEAFTLERVGKSGAVFDAAKLRWMNAHYLHHAHARDLRRWIEAARAPGESIPWLDAFDALTGGTRGEALEPVLELVRGNLSTLEDLPQELGYLLDRPRLEPDATEALNAPRAREVCRETAAALDALAEWTANGIKSAIQQVGARLGVKGRDLFQPIRAALTGRTHGPELPALAEFLGKDRARLYLMEAANR